MNEITIEWKESGRTLGRTIQDQQASKVPGAIRLGRDPARCDIVLHDPTVSGLHVEIFFHPKDRQFYLRNLRYSNPPLVDGISLTQGEVPLTTDSIFYLGQVEVRVLSIHPAVPPSPPPVAPTILKPSHPPQQSQTAPTLPPATYGLQCPQCQRVSPYERQDIGCSWCGTSLAAAASVLMNPHS